MAVATSEAATDAVGELDQYQSQFEGDATPTLSAVESEPESPATPEPVATPPIHDPWGEIVDDERLPPSLRGKTRKDVWEANLDAIARANRAGMEKNDAERRAMALEAINQQLIRERTPQAPPPKPHEQFGLASENDVYANLPQVMNAIPSVAERAAEAKFAPLAQKLQALENENLWTRAENARAQARDIAKIDSPETWESMRPAMASLLAANNLDPRDSRSWVTAADFLRSIAPKLVPQVAAVAPVAAPPAGNGKPAATSTAAKKVVTTGDKKLDAEIRDMCSLYGTKFEDVVANINGDPMRRAGAYE